MRRLPFLFIVLFSLLPLVTFSQKWEWLKSEGGDRAGGAIRMNEGTAVCTDEAGNLYVAGFFSGVGVFGKDTIKNYMDMNSLLIKYDAAGKVLWAKQVTHGATDFVYSICLDPQENVCVTGDKSGSAIRSFAAKYDSKGNLLWSNDATGEHCHSSSRAIAADKAGNIYVAGDCQGIISFDTFSIGTEKKYTMFLVKYTSAGKVLWVRHSEPADNYYNQARCMAIDHAGNIYVSGEYFQSAKFGSQRISGKGESDVFIARYNSNGYIQWLRSYGGAGKDRAESMVTDAKGALYLTAYFSAPFSEKGKSITGSNLVKFSTAGDIAWNTQIGVGPKDFYISSFVAIDASGYLYLTGNTYGAIPLFGEKTGACNGASDLFVAKCDPNGKCIWKIQAGGTGVDEGKAVCIDRGGNFYVTGYFHGKVDFGQFTIQSKSGDDGIFVGKLK